jgi:hypothetical protein
MAPEAGSWIVCLSDMPDVMTGGVLWDLDGTLVDSADLHWRSWRETLRAERV